MNFLLKIVEGPNKGAEIALPEGVAVTLGKGDECDIVLADPTMPDEPATVTASTDGVTLNGGLLEQFQVATLGATSFATGPADATWGELKWSKEEKGEEEGKEKTAPESGSAEEGKDDSSRVPGSASPESASEEAPAEKKRSGGCFGCLLILLILLIAAAIVAWFFREQARPYAEKVWRYAEKVVSRMSGGAGDAGGAGETMGASLVDPLDALVERYGLSMTNRDGRIMLAGDFATRAERLSATAEAYAARPGVEIDFCDDESLKTAAEDTFALVGETKLRVTAATNRFVVLSGAAVNLRRTLEAMAADLPKLKNVDASAVRLLSGNEGGVAGEAGAAPARNALRKSSRKASSFPVCGILTSPYPCLVLRNGTRLMEGAPLGDSVILKIESDSVTLTNSTGRFTWKP